MKPVLGIEQLHELFEVAFPDVPRGRFSVDKVAPGRVVCRMTPRAGDLRPGGTIRGPALMALVDTTALFVVLAHIGPQLGVVTTSLHIDFLRRPALGDLRAEGELLKLGKRLAVIDVRIYSLPTPPPSADTAVDGAAAAAAADPALPCVARAAVTYALPG